MKEDQSTNETDDRNDSLSDPVPEELRMAVEGIRMQNVPEQSMNKTLRAAENIGMTGAAWKRGFINMIAVAVPMAIFVEIVKRVLGGQTQFEKLMSVFWITVAIVIVCVSIGMIQAWLGWRRAGRVLIDAGAHPGRRVFWLNAAVVACFGVGALWAGRTSLPPAMGFAMLGFSLFFVVLSAGRLQFCSAGIWQYWNLLRWENIASYEFVEGVNPTLLVRTNSRIPFLRRGAFPVSRDMRDHIESVLAEHVDASGKDS